MKRVDTRTKFTVALDRQTVLDLERWAESEARSRRNLAIVLIRRGVSEWRTKNQQQKGSEAR